MRVVFAAGPTSELGGSAKYAANLKEQFEKRNIQVTLVSFSNTLPSGIRHAAYFLRLLSTLLFADAIVAFDTWSVGFPAVVAAKVLRKPSVVRIGGDFLWEHYVERTGDLVKLSAFYDLSKEKWNRTERTIYTGTSFLLKNASMLAFNSKFQIDLWEKEYSISLHQANVIENVYPKKKENSEPTARNFVAAGRPVKLKQEKLLQEIFSDLQQQYPDISLDMRSLPQAEHQLRVSTCYAVLLGSVSDVSPNVIIDAVVHERPFICTNDTGISERLQGLGLFVDTQNKEALKAAIESLLDQSVYKKCKTELKMFSFVRTWDDVAEDFLTAIQSCKS